MSLKRGFKAKSERIAADMRKKLGLEPHSPMSGFALANLLEIPVFKISLLEKLDPSYSTYLSSSNGSCFSAVTIEVAGKYYITLNCSHSLTRQESTMMHELAHVICKHSMGEYQISEIVSFRPLTEEFEEEANWLGGSLHVPRAGLLWAKKQRMDDAGMSDYFNASLEQIRYRRNVTGVDIQYRRKKRQA